MKKILLLLLSLFITFWFWVIFARVAKAPEPEYVCSKFKNVKIDNYKVVIQNGTKFYEPKIGKCIKHNSNDYRFPHSDVFLVDKSINVTSITNENINSISIPLNRVWTPNNIWYYNQVTIYKISNYWGTYYLDAEHYYQKEGISITSSNKSIKFGIVRLITILIETIVLLIIKFFRKSWSLKIWKLITTWILASTVTFPLLYFVLPIFFSNYWICMIIWEILATIIETFIIKYSLKIRWGMAIFASILCNLISFLIWLFIF